MTTEPVIPRLSATVLIIRDAGDLEVLMVARHYEIDFAAGALVFPGGKSNPEDASDAWDDYVDGDCSGEQRTARIAAVREVFEESGLLLARSRSSRGAGAALIGNDMSHKLDHHRAAVDRQETSFLGLMRENDLVLALDCLVHFGHWITPEVMPKRFDTHFYLAQAPSNQVASHDGRETTDAIWINPNTALEQERLGEATIIFPTRMNLIKLGRSENCDVALEAARKTSVVSVLPEIGKDDQGRPCLFIPEAAGYGQTLELMERIKV